MAHAAESVQDSTILSGQPSLAFSNNGYSYRIERRGDQSIYSVTDGNQTLAIPIGWAVGAGLIGQTYVYERDGEFYESRVSYFSEIKGLDITMGHERSRPADIVQAAGRRMGSDETVRCFGCHTTNGVEDRKLALDKMLPGVQCSHCHEAAPKHLAGLSEGELDLDEMKKMSAMSTGKLLDFCGRCHRTLEEVLSIKVSDIRTVRFQPYRLALSKCYDPDDRRIGCLACHDPHEELKHDQAHYDPKCLACHVGGKAGAPACKVSKKDCASCHMPKLELPGSHHRFSDHFIRVMRPSDPFTAYLKRTSP